MNSALLVVLLLSGAIPYPDLAGLEPVVATQLAPLPELVQAAQAAGDSEALGEAGKLYQAYGLLDTAIACYDEALVAAGGDFRWRYLRAAALGAAGKTEAAAAGYQAALEVRPAEIAPRVHLGTALLGLGRLSEARAAFEATLATAPETAAAFAGLGQVALSEQRYAEAVALFERALELAPQAGALHYPLALAFRGLGNLDAARRHLTLKTTVGVKPPDSLLAELETIKNGARVMMARGFKAFANGDVTAAEQSFRRALAADENLVAARINLAAALERLGRLTEAKAELERATALAPDNATARFNLGLLLLRAGEAGATVHLREAVRLRPDDAEARRELANALLAGGELAESAKVLRQAIADLPTDGAIALALTHLLVAAPDPALRDGKFALNLAERLFEALPSADHASLVAAALAELDRCSEAASWQERALALAGATAHPALRTLLEQYRNTRPCRLSLEAPLSKP